jgi:pyruvate carboxylase
MAKELEAMGAHILAIKDMAGLCKPYAAERLVKDAAGGDRYSDPFPHARHGGVQAAAILKAADVGLDIADAAMAPMSGGTSQPNLNTLVEALRFSDRDSGLPPAPRCAREYWRGVREFTRRSRVRCCRQEATCTSTKCPAASTRICSSRPTRSDCRPSGRRSAGCMPK